MVHIKSPILPFESGSKKNLSSPKDLCEGLLGHPVEHQWNKEVVVEKGPITIRREQCALHEPSAWSRNC
jgi:hypothetical protein